MSVVAERMKIYPLFLKIFLGHPETIGKNGDHAHNIGIARHKGIYGVQAAFSGTDKILYHHHILIGFHEALYLVLPTVRLGFGPYIHKWKSHIFGNQHTDTNSSSGHAGNRIRTSVPGPYVLAHFLAYVIAYGRIGKNDPIVAVDRGFPSRGPCKRI